MRKRAIKREKGTRNLAFKTYRTLGDTLVPFANKNGEITFLNLSKRMLLGDGYSYPGYQKELDRATMEVVSKAMKAREDVGVTDQQKVLEVTQEEPVDSDG